MSIHENENSFTKCIKSINVITFKTFGSCTWRFLGNNPILKIQQTKQCFISVIPFGKELEKVCLAFDDTFQAVDAKLATIKTENASKETSEENESSTTNESYTAAEIHGTDILDKAAAQNIAANFISDNLIKINELCQDSIAAGYDSFILIPDDNRPAVLEALVELLTSDWHNYKSAEIIRDDPPYRLKVGVNLQGMDDGSNRCIEESEPDIDSVQTEKNTAEYETQEHEDIFDIDYDYIMNEYYAFPDEIPYAVPELMAE